MRAIIISPGASVRGLPFKLPTLSERALAPVLLANTQQYGRRLAGVANCWMAVSSCERCADETYDHTHLWGAVEKPQSMLCACKHAVSWNAYACLCVCTLGAQRASPVHVQCACVCLCSRKYFPLIQRRADCAWYGVCTCVCLFVRVHNT